MNNYPLRGGKSAYFEGGIRAASFVHSPLLPAHTAGSVLKGLVSLADWYATFCFLASVQPDDDAGDIATRRRARQHYGALPPPYGAGTFPIDSINLWPWLSGKNSTAPRQELVLGKMAGGSMIAAGGFKVVLASQTPDWWYGSYAPNCTDGNGAHPHNCEDGCLFHIDSDAGEHTNLKASQPARFAALKARLQAEQAVRESPLSSHSGVDSAGVLDGDSGACAAMETKWRGFFGAPHCRSH